MRGFLILFAVLSLCLIAAVPDATAGCPCQQVQRVPAVVVTAPVLAPVACDAPAVVVTERSILTGPITVQGQPVRNAGRAVVFGTGRAVRGATRVVTAPFRLLFRGRPGGGSGGCGGG